MLLIPLLWCAADLSAQRTTVGGVVTGSPDGAPVAGASVVVKGSLRGTTTDASGAFRIAAAADETLVVSFLGYKPQEVAVAGRTAVDIRLEEDAELVDEVVVIGYGTMRKSDLTGSVATVRASDVTQVSSGSIDKLLQGRVAGLTVIDNSNDSPQGGVTVRVRGISSINGSNAPLVVVDGVPMGDAGNLTSVNPAIVESIEVLKDASATAIYGSRGANGVIMVTTKSGQRVQNNVWFSAKVGVGVFSDQLDYWRDPVLMARLENESYENGGAEGPYTGKIWADGTYYPSISEIESGAWPYRTRWADHVFRTSVTQDYSVGVEGSGKNNRYYVSLGYYDGEGMQHNDDYEKYTVDMSYDHKVARDVSLKTKAGFVRGFRTYNNGTSYGVNPLWPVYNGDGSYFRSNPKDYGNPVMINREVNRGSDDMTGYALVKADWTILPGLTFAASGNVRAEQSRSSYFNPPLYTLQGDNYNGEGGNSESTYVNLACDAYLTWNRTFGDHALSAMAGTGYENSVSRGSTITGRGFTNAALKDEVVSGADKVITSTSRSQEMLASAFTRLNYAYKNRYLFTFTARADGASKFAEGHRWGFFPSGAVSWKMEEEPWIRQLDFFDQLKLRASYGVSGNQGILPYQTFERFGYDYYWCDGREYRAYGIGYQDGRQGLGDRFVTYAGMANHELTWEKTAQMDIGLDLSIFRGRLSLTFDYYVKRTTDLLRKQYLAPSTGFDGVGQRRRDPQRGLRDRTDGPHRLHPRLELHGHGHLQPQPQQGGGDRHGRKFGRHGRRQRHLLHAVRRRCLQRRLPQRAGHRLPRQFVLRIHGQRYHPDAAGRRVEPQHPSGRVELRGSESRRHARSLAAHDHRRSQSRLHGQPQSLAVAPLRHRPFGDDVRRLRQRHLLGAQARCAGPEGRPLDAGASEQRASESALQPPVPRLVVVGRGRFVPAHLEHHAGIYASARKGQRDQAYAPVCQRQQSFHLLEGERVRPRSG